MPPELSTSEMQRAMITLFLIWMVLGAIVAIIAHSKGRTAWKWFLYGSMLFVVAIVHVLVTKKSRAKVEEEAIESGDMKRCVRCAELIRSEAAVCRICRAEQYA